jgi:hypothetical protein
MADVAHDKKIRSQIAWILSLSLLMFTFIFFKIDYTDFTPKGMYLSQVETVTIQEGTVSIQEAEAYGGGSSTTTTLPACKDAKTPFCSGQCPIGEWCRCRDDGSGCGCIQFDISCGNVDSAFCAQGKCSKPDEVCRLDKTSGKCGCIPEVKYDECGGQCSPLYCSTGICPPSLQCQTNMDKFECQCAPPQTETECAKQKDGFCMAGACPDKYVCTVLSKAGTCGCVKLELTPCGEIEGDNAFTCMIGGCEKEGETCQLDMVSGKCGCTSDNPIDLCNQKKYPYCGGGICVQPHFACRASETNKVCACLPDNPGCNGYSPFSCSEGTCEEGQVCALTDGGYCDCVVKPPTNQCGDQDWFYCIDGKCPKGEMCTRISNPDPGCACQPAPECGSLTAPLCNGGGCPEGEDCKAGDSAYGGPACGCEPETSTGTVPIA